MKFLGQHTVRHTGNEGGSQIDDTRVTNKASFRIVLDSSTLENGNVVVVYDPDGDRGRGDNGLFFFEVLDENGDIVVAGSSSSLRTQNDCTPSFSRNPTFDPVVKGLKSNRFVIARTETDKNARDERIVIELFDANGTSIVERTVGDRISSPDQNEPTIAALDDGGFIVFYDQDRSNDFRIRGQRFDAAGEPVGEDFTVANENGFQLDATGLRNGQAAICYNFASNVKLAILDTAFDEARIEASTSDTPALAGA